MATMQRNVAEAEPIFVSRPDRDRLQALVDGYRDRRQEDPGTLERLEQELERAVVMEPGEVPADVVTLGSGVVLLDLDSNEILSFSVVLPSRANADEGRISVLAPLGMAVLGYRTGSEMEWTVPGGLRRLRVQSVTPSAGGR